MRIGIGNRGVSVQGGNQPIRGRIGREAGFHGENFRTQIAVTLFDGVEARLRAQDSEPGRPDMGGNQTTSFARAQHYLQQVAGIELQGRTPVGAKRAETLQFFYQAACAGEVGHVNHMMHLVRPAVFFVDRGYLHLEHEVGCVQRTRCSGQWTVDNGQWRAGQFIARC